MSPLTSLSRFSRRSRRRTHAPGIVECSNGDLIASWYGDTRPNDSAVLGARKRKDEMAWCEPFVMADRPDFPDCNTAMNIDSRGRLWLYWPTIIGGSWESSLLNYQVATNYSEPGPPKWNRNGVILLKPADFSGEASGCWERVRSSRLAEQLEDRPSRRRNWPTRSISDWAGLPDASRQYCPAAGSSCRFIPIRFRYRSWL